MLQSSLLGWLAKPAGVNSAEAGKQRNSLTGNDDSETGLPTPPSSSQDNLPAAPIAPAEGSRKAQLSMIAHSGPSLPPNVEFRACTKEDISHFKRLNSLLLAIPYPESFYREIIEDQQTNDMTLLAVWHDDLAAVGKEKGRLVGAIRCKLLAYPPISNPYPTRENEGPMLYLSTLVLLSPYRKHGIATRMLDIVTRRAVFAYGIVSVGAHVWEANMEGLEWYRKRAFLEVSKDGRYYRRLKPQGAVVVQRRVRVMDLAA